MEEIPLRVKVQLPQQSLRKQEIVVWPIGVCCDSDSKKVAHWHDTVNEQWDSLNKGWDSSILQSTSIKMNDDDN